MSRTGLSAADIAEQFRDSCGDGSVEWTYTPMQTWVLLDAADMLDENAKLREQIHWLKQGDILHVLTDQEYIDQCERERLMQVSIDALDKENAKLRELVAAMPYCMESRCLECPMCSPFDTSIGGVPECRASWKLCELGVEP